MSTNQMDPLLHVNHFGKILQTVCVFPVIAFLLVAAISCVEPTDSEWEILFDGSSTSAWRGFHRSEFPDQGWIIDRDSLKTIPGGDVVGIITRDQYESFELTLEWRVSAGGNSGIFLHVSEESPSVWASAFEFQILDDKLSQDGDNPLTSAGALYDLIAPQNKVLRPVGEYNEARVIAHGQHIEHWLNGVKVVKFDSESSELKAMISKSKFQHMRNLSIAPIGSNRMGHVGLQHHGQEVWLRNIKIRRLTPR